MSEFIIQTEQLLSAFGDAEYRYLLIEPLIFYGILIGVVMLIVAHFMKKPKIQMAALIVVGISALAHVPYKEARLAAQPRIEQVYKISSPARVKGFKENTQAWVAASWKFRLLILTTALAVMVGVNTNRVGFALGILTAFLGLLSTKTAVWLHYQDAIAYHPNLKQHVAPIDQREKSVQPSPPKTRVTVPAGSVSPPPPSSPPPAAYPQYTPSTGRISPPPPAPGSGPRPRSVKPL
ncbi:MAG: hypothetical protein P1U85_02015 [Verrucomicrobiales bacterium]|nr:hypothetical protein [Verrucomicrobiales bacterium]